MVISLGQLPSAGCDQNNFHSLSAGAKRKASDHLRNLSSQRHSYPKVLQRVACRRPGRKSSPGLATLGRLHRREGRSWILAAPALPHVKQPLPPLRQWREEGSGREASTQLLPTPSPQKQLRSSGHGCQVPPSNLVAILTEERIPRGPPAEMPLVRERLFSFPFAVNEFYSWQQLGAGSHPHRS